MLKNKMESYVRIGGKGLKNLTYHYMGVGGVKNCQNHPYVINEWPQTVQHSSNKTWKKHLLVRGLWNRAHN